MNTAQARKITYWVVSITLALMYLAVPNNNWSGTKELHTVMETLATVLAFFIGIMSLIRFYSNGKALFLILGAGAIGVASLDGLHAVLTSNWLGNSRSSDLDSLIPWSWLASRILLAFIFLSILVFSQIKLEKLPPILVSKKFIYLITTSAVCFSVLLLIFIPLPSGYYDNEIINRPADIIPGIIFIITLFYILKSSRWRSEEIEHWLVIAVILSAYTQLLYMPLSKQLFDSQFDIAHLLKILSYICILSGLIISFYKDFMNLETEVNVKKYAQKALEASEVRNRTLMNSLVDGLLTISNKGVIENINTSACKLFGYSKLELLGKNIKILMPEPYHSEHDGYLRNYEQTGKAKIIGIGRKVIGLKKSGETFPIDLSVSEMIVNGIKKYSGIVRDDTERNKAEEEIINSRNKAELAAQAKSDFLATMSHEIRTPMNGVVGMVELLQGTPLNHEQKDIVNTISESGHALVDLINDILEISKIESGKIEFNYTEFNLEKAAYDVIKLLTTRADDNDIELILHYHSNCPKKVIGDAGRTRQVLLNLVGNAVKFTHQGHVLVDISCCASSDNFHDIVFKIIDTGIGIDESQKNKLFESFTQADSSTSRKYGGTGLGLSISKKIINLMDGELDVISSSGEGSTFWFKLKLESSPIDIKLDENLKEANCLTYINNPIHREILDDHLRSFNIQVDNQNSHDALLNKVSFNPEDKTDRKKYKFIILDTTCTQEEVDALSKTIQSQSGIQPVPVILYNTGTATCPINLKNQNISGEITPPLISDNIYKQLCIALNFTKKPYLETSNNKTSEEKHRINRAQLEQKIIESDINILLVEDVVVNQKVALGIMSDFKSKIDIANNGQEAIDMHNLNNYDIILMDCQMPVMDGYKATNIIRQTDTHTPIIAITANALSTDKEKCFDAGMNDYLTKPYNRQQLIERISHWLTNAKTRPSIDNTVDNTNQTTINSNSSNSSIIDTSKLEEMKNIMGGMFKELIPAYIEQSDNYIKKMPDSLDQNSLEDLERYAHSLKSSSLNVGASTLSDLSRDLEALSRTSQEKDLLLDKINLITREYKQVKTALIEFKERGKENVNR